MLTCNTYNSKGPKIRYTFKQNKSFEGCLGLLIFFLLILKYVIFPIRYLATCLYQSGYLRRNGICLFYKKGLVAVVFKVWHACFTQTPLSLKLFYTQQSFYILKCLCSKQNKTTTTTTTTNQPQCNALMPPKAESNRLFRYQLKTMVEGY